MKLHSIHLIQTLRIFLLLGFSLIGLLAYSQENCSNGIDDDLDGLIDLNDLIDCPCDNTEFSPSIIPNHSFENMDCCPDSYSQLTCASNWIQASNATSDYYNTCGQFPPWVQSTAADGNGVVGAIYRIDWQEHVGTCLSEPIVANTDYLLQMSISSRIALTGAANDLGAIDIIIYGSPNCSDLPFAGEVCPIGSGGSWQIIGSYNYDPSMDWSEIDITLTSSIDINAITIGPPCTFPDAYLNSDLFPYFVYDNLLLNSTDPTEMNLDARFYNEENDIWVENGTYVDPISGLDQNVGAICADLVEIVLNTSSTGSNQWYYEGAAIVGETDTILSLAYSDFNAGEYECITIDSLTMSCNAISYSGDVPEIPAANFSIDLSNVCVPVNLGITDASSHSGQINDWTWYVDGQLVESGIDNISTTISTAGLHTASLVVESDNFCTDSIFSSMFTGEPPIITTSVSNACVGEEATFNGQATSSSGLEITDWLWDFGDGTTSELQSPTHSFADENTYMVILSVIDDNKCSNSDTLFITPLTGPQTLFETEDICLGNFAIFSNSTTFPSGNVDAWAWDFGNGQTSSDFEPENHYEEGGNYNVTLTAIGDNGCESNFSTTQVVNDTELNVDFSVQNTCHTDLTRFSDQSSAGSTASVNSWSWDFGDGNSAVGPNPTHTYSNAQNHEVHLTITSTNNCTSEIIKSVEINPLPEINFNNDDICLGSSVAYFDNNSSIVSGSIDQWIWTFGDLDSAFVENPNHTYAQAGDYEINCIGISSEGCSSDASSTQIVFDPAPSVDFDILDLCYGSNTSFSDLSTIVSAPISSWNWDFGDGSTSALQNPVYAFNSTDSYDITLTVVDSNECIADNTMSITILPTPSISFNANPVCIEDPKVQFTNNSYIESGEIESWNWDFGDENTSSDINPSNSYEQAGNYTVILSALSEQGCEGRDTLEQIVSQSISEIAYQIDPGCSPTCGSFESRSASVNGEIVEYNWTFSNEETNVGEMIEHCFDNPSNLDVLLLNATLNVVNSFGCKDSITLDSIIEIWPNPIADFESDLYVTSFLQPHFNFNNLSIGNFSNIWDFGDEGLSGAENPSHTYESPLIYPVELTVYSNLGCTDNLTMHYTVEPVYNIFVPTAFTPSGDGINEVFRPVVNGDYIDDYSFQVYDRDGHVVYETSDVNESWDGSYFNENSHYVADGLYTWVMTVQFINNTDIIVEKGTLTILR